MCLSQASWSILEASESIPEHPRAPESVQEASRNVPEHPPTGSWHFSEHYFSLITRSLTAFRKLLLSTHTLFVDHTLQPSEYFLSIQRLLAGLGRFWESSKQAPERIQKHKCLHTAPRSRASHSLVCDRPPMQSDWVVGRTFRRRCRTHLHTHTDDNQMFSLQHGTTTSRSKRFHFMPRPLVTNLTPCLGHAVSGLDTCLGQSLSLLTPSPASRLASDSTQLSKASAESAKR